MGCFCSFESFSQCVCVYAFAYACALCVNVRLNVPERVCKGLHVDICVKRDVHNVEGRCGEGVKWPLHPPWPHLDHLFSIAFSALFNFWFTMFLSVHFTMKEQIKGGRMKTGFEYKWM